MHFLADAAVNTLEFPGTSVVSTLDGVTTALVAFVIAGLVWPHIVKKRAQFFAIVGVVMVIIALNALALIVRNGGFTVFTGVLIGLCQIVGLAMAVMCTGGMSARQLTGELSRSYEVMRRGEETKEVIIPIAGSKKADEEPERKVYTIDTPPGPAKPPAPPSESSIPLEE